LLEYLRVNQAAAAGMPMAFATGAGEATNRATLNNQQQILELSLEQIIKKTVSSFQKYILRRIGLVNFNSVKYVPKLIWGDIRAEEKNEKAKRLIDYVNVGALAPDEIREYAATSEDLEVDLERVREPKQTKEPKEDTPENPEEKEEDRRG